MNLFEAILLGIIQGLTEFLPVSSSGHLEISKALLGVDAERSLMFTVVVHGATVLSTLVVFRQDLARIIMGLFRRDGHEERGFAGRIFVSMIPVLLVGLFLKDEVESLFDGRIRFVGMMLGVTALLLYISTLVKAQDRSIRYIDALIIGIAQALAVIPGISRSGATIATGLMLGNARKDVARFSFLMVIIPIIGANLLDIRDYDSSISLEVPLASLLAGFLAAFATGWLACRWMVQLVQKGKLIYFAFYCLIIGILAVLIGSI